MHRSRKRILIALAALALIAASGLGIYLFRREQVNRLPDIRRDGGTVLVYEIEDGVDPNGPHSLEDLARAVERRVASGIPVAFAEVRTLPPRRIEIAIPRFDWHEEFVEETKALLLSKGQLEFRILANRHDDREVLEIAREYFDAAGTTWREFLDAVRQKFPEVDKAGRIGDSPSIFDLDCGDEAGLKVLLRQGRPKVESEEIDRWIATNFRPSPTLRDLINREMSGLPPARPVGPNGATFRIQLNDGEHDITYSWIELAKNKVRALQLEDDALQGKEDDLRLRVQAARHKGELLQDAMGEAEFRSPLYSRKVLSRTRFGPRDEEKAHEYFLLIRDPEPGKAVTEKHVSSAQEEVGRGGRVGVGFRLNSRGGDLLHELTSANKPPPENIRNRRSLVMILDGQITAVLALSWSIRDAGIIEGSSNQNEVRRMVRLLNSGTLPLPLKPLPVSEETVEPGQRR